MVTHEKDSDCTVDPETGLCAECGVGHDDPCIECGGTGFHLQECTLLESFEDFQSMNRDAKDLSSIEEAIRIINKARNVAASGSTTIWRILAHAGEYLDKQIAAGLGRA